MKRRGFLKGAGVLGLGGLAAAIGGIAWGRSRNPYYDGPISDHFDGLRFFNPGGEAPKGFVELIKWQLNGERKNWPNSYPSPHSDTPPERVAGDAMRVSFVGHATMLVQMDGLNVLTDPVWSERVSPVSWAGPKRANAPGIDFDRLPPIDAVLLSHNHYDHLDVETLSRLAAAHDPLVVTPLGNDTILRDHDERIRVVAHDWGDAVDLPSANGVSAKVTLVPAHHWSARGTTDRRNALWCAFVLDHPAGRIYHVGDTGWFGGRNHEAIGREHGPFRLALQPFGAYRPRDFMRAQHQDPDEAVRAHLVSRSAHTLGHHWGTFQLTDEHIDDQIADLDAALVRHGVSPETFRRLQPGEFWDVPPRPAGMA